MSKAEERALEAYPPKFTSGKRYAKRVQSEKVDTHAPIRKKYLKGYEQAEKDLALTIQDLELLHTFLYAVKNNKHGCFTFTSLSDEQYAEVLKRFKEARK